MYEKKTTELFPSAVGEKSKKNRPCRGLADSSTRNRAGKWESKGGGERDGVRLTVT